MRRLTKRNPELPAGGPVEPPAAVDPLVGLPGEALGDLAVEARRGLVWSSGSRAIGQLLQFGSSIVLARLLTPRDFGLIATVYIFAGLASLLKDMGIASSIVRKRHVSQADLATAFWINALVGVGFTLVVGALGPVLASLYDAPELVALMWLVGVTFTISVHAVPIALLERRMEFRRIARVDVAAFVLGAAAAMTAAANGLGYYSLIVSPIVQALVMSVCFIRMTRFRPHGFIDRAAARELWAYTGGYTGANLLTYVRSNVDGLIVGKMLGQSALGYYGRGMVLVSMPLAQVNTVLHRVMLPTLSRLRDDRKRLARVYLSTVAVVCVAAGAGMAVLAAVADILVPVIWGQQWLPVVPVVQWLAVAGALQVAAVPTGWICEVEGRTGLLMQLTMLTTTVTVAGIFVGVQFGIVGVAVALAVTAAIDLIPSLLISAHLLRVNPLVAAKHLLPGLLAAGATYAAMTAVSRAIADDVLLRLVAQGLAAVLVFAVGVLLLDRVLDTGIVIMLRKATGRPLRALG